MPEINLQPMVEDDKNDTKLPTPMQEIDSALKDCKFGRFHVRLLCSSLIATITGVHITSSASYLLPNAECDLDMSLEQKGLLNAMPYTGMVFSTVLAGFLTDTFGRAKFVRFGNTGLLLFSMVAAFSQTYSVLVTAKFFEGFLFAVSFNACLTLTYEFCHSGVRDRVMLLQSSFAATAQVVIAILAWSVLSQDWSRILFDGYIVLHSWNFYLIIMSLFPLTTVTLYCFVPESPKYLVTQQKYDKAREILINIYKENTGKPAETYPSINIWMNKTKNAYKGESEKKILFSIKKQLVVGLHNVKPLFQKPMLCYLTLLCVMNFIVMAMFNMFRLWFPQLLTIVEHYGVESVNGNTDLCDMLDSYTNNLKYKINDTESQPCITTKIGTETYIYSIILGSSCIIPYVVSGILVKKVKKKNLLFIAGSIASATALALRWTNTKVLVVALFSLSVAISQTMMSLLQVVTVEFFPTTTRTLAVSLLMCIGRIGSLSGNIVFPILLGIACVIPFFALSGLMLCVVALNIFLPVKTK